jgi:two-component system nitrate/nitrite response regulator NarL
MKTYRIIIVDDHPLARKAIRRILEDADAFDILAEAANGEEAIAVCRQFQPDVVLMDIHMPVMNGLEAARIIKQNNASIKIVILSVSDHAADLFSAIQFGIQGYLLKNMDPAEWLKYLQALLEDDVDIPREMADRLYDQFKTRPVAADVSEDQLTPRETEIMALIAAGNTNRQIADALVIAENTVKNHIKNVLFKLTLENRVQLAAYAFKHGLTEKT